MKNENQTAVAAPFGAPANHSKELAALKLQQEKEIAALKLQQEATDKTGFKCIGYSHRIGLGFMAYTPYVYEKGIKTLSDVQKIMEVYKPGKENFVLTFSGRENEPTESPFHLQLHSSEGMKPTAKLSYKSIEGIDISIELPIDLPIFTSYLANGKHKGFGRYESYKVLSLVNAKGFNLTNYSGNYKSYTGTTENFNQLLNV